MKIQKLRISWRPNIWQCDFRRVYLDVLFVVETVGLVISLVVRSLLGSEGRKGEAEPSCTLHRVCS